MMSTETQNKMFYRGTFAKYCCSHLVRDEKGSWAEEASLLTCALLLFPYIGLDSITS